MNLHKARVFRTTEGHYKGIWKGECKCGYKTQYWSWGAVLGAIYQHYWKARYE